MFTKKRVLLATLILVCCCISVLGVIADLFFNLGPTVGCPDDGAIFTRVVLKDRNGNIRDQYWDKDLPRYAEVHIESTVIGNTPHKSTVSNRGLETDNNARLLTRF